jgi:hypothetical protein
MSAVYYILDKEYIRLLRKNSDCNRYMLNNISDFNTAIGYLP